ncbi:GtrA family protein [Austwickia chelonae]|uniref:GtrA family protein n=1 Tax=Austwickia chelonae TaxID=100225 RepID=UPI0013C36E87|nr:GtrA family protein [Austwickia chelonae]
MRKLWNHAGLRQIVVFGVIGALGVLVNLAISIVLHRANGGTVNAGDPLFSLPGGEYSFRFRNFVWLAAFFGANLSNFELNRRYTFANHSAGRWFRRYLAFCGSGIVAMFVGMICQWALTHPDSFFYLDYSWLNESEGIRSREYWAQIIAIFVSTPVNFVASKYLVFRHRPTSETLDPSLEGQ